MRVGGLILAGGQGSRMQGKDKGWLDLGSEHLIDIVINRLEAQVDEIMISANRNIERYKQLNKRVVEDSIAGYQGPLAGMLSGLAHCRHEIMVTVPCDCPFLPTDLVLRLLAKQHSTQADVVSVSDGTRIHPVFALLKVGLHDAMKSYLDSGRRKIDRWYEKQNFKVIEYPPNCGYFENINTPEQLLATQQKMAGN